MLGVLTINVFFLFVVLQVMIPVSRDGQADQEVPEDPAGDEYDEDGQRPVVQLHLQPQLVLVVRPIYGFVH